MMTCTTVHYCTAFTFYQLELYIVMSELRFELIKKLIDLLPT